MSTKIKKYRLKATIVTVMHPLVQRDIDRIKQFGGTVSPDHPTGTEIFEIFDPTNLAELLSFLITKNVNHSYGQSWSWEWDRER